MKEPNGFDLLKTLVDLYADQEGVKITYQIETKEIDSMADTYKETKVFEFPGMIARVHIPDLTQGERSRRMKAIHKAAENLLKKS